VAGVCYLLNETIYNYKGRGKGINKTCKESIWIRPSIGLGLNLTSPNNEFIERG